MIIYLCLVGSPMVLITTHVTSYLVTETLYNQKSGHYIRIASAISFRTAIVTFVLGIGIYLVLTTALPEPVQACSDIT